jgi:acyl carrier protein
MDVADRIKGILVEDVFVEVPPTEMDEDDSLRDVFGLDSMGFIELRVQCESQFGVTIDDDDFASDNFASIRTVVKLVKQLQHAATPASNGRSR